MPKVLGRTPLTTRGRFRLPLRVFEADGLPSCLESERGAPHSGGGAKRDETSVRRGRLTLPAEDLGLRRVEEPAPRAIVVHNLMIPYVCSLLKFMS